VRVARERLAPIVASDGAKASARRWCSSDYHAGTFLADGSMRWAG
jgi:hypothetical protein